MYNGGARALPIPPPKPADLSESSPADDQTAGYYHSTALAYSPTAPSMHAGFARPGIVHHTNLPFKTSEQGPFSFEKRYRSKSFHYNSHNVGVDRGRRYSDGPLRDSVDPYVPYSSSPDREQEQERDPALVDGDLSRTYRGLDWDKLTPDTRLFVKGIDIELIDKWQIRELFEKYGEVLEVSLKGAYGFVQFNNPDSVLHAIRGEDGRVLKGMKLALEVCKHRPRSVTSGDKIQYDQNTSFTPLNSSRRDSYRPILDRHRPDREYYSRESSVTSSQGGHQNDKHGDLYAPTGYNDPPFRERLVSSFAGPDRPRDGNRELRARDFKPYDRPVRGRRNSAPERNFGVHERPPPWDNHREWERDYDSELMEPPLPRPYRPEPNRSKSLGHTEAAVYQILILGRVDPAFLRHVGSRFRAKALTTHSIYVQPHKDIESIIQQLIADGSRGVLIVDERRVGTNKVKLQVFERSSDEDGNVRFDEYESITVDEAVNIIFLRTKTKQPLPQPQFTHQPLPQNQLAHQPSPTLEHLSQPPPFFAPRDPSQFFPQPSTSSHVDLTPLLTASPLDIQNLAALFGLANIPLQQQQQQQCPVVESGGMPVDPALTASLAAQARDVLELLKNEERR